jgi:hypothetical protein
MQGLEGSREKLERAEEGEESQADATSTGKVAVATSTSQQPSPPNAFCHTAPTRLCIDQNHFDSSPILFSPSSLSLAFSPARCISTLKQTGFFFAEGSLVD